AEQSYCILMTGYKLSNDAKERIQTMCRTNNGFEIADVDMRLRGPGNIEGTQQSGVMDLKIANIVQDGAILRTARVMAEKIIGQDINLTSPENRKLANHLKDLRASSKDWGRIS
ncbi:MAG: ATP-dependent DNA helicase RecG, partial [Ignavibacteria bacterium]|nr:ATP-dependent DNA helicase RecG [Ignavibacteria bacterium]